MIVFCAGLHVKIYEMIKRPNLAVRLNREAKKRRRNLPERSPSPGKTLAGPVFKAFAKPKLAVKMEVANVTEKKVRSEPVKEKSAGSSIPSVPSVNAEMKIEVKMAVVGMASQYVSPSKASLCKILFRASPFFGLVQMRRITFRARTWKKLSLS